MPDEQVLCGRRWGLSSAYLCPSPTSLRTWWSRGCCSSSSPCLSPAAPAESGAPSAPRGDGPLAALHARPAPAASKREQQNGASRNALNQIKALNTTGRGGAPWCEAGLVSAGWGWCSSTSRTTRGLAFSAAPSSVSAERVCIHTKYLQQPCRKSKSVLLFYFLRKRFTCSSPVRCEQTCYCKKKIKKINISMCR